MHCSCIIITIIKLQYITLSLHSQVMIRLCFEGSRTISEWSIIILTHKYIVIEDGKLPEKPVRERCGILVIIPTLVFQKAIFVGYNRPLFS